MLFLFSLIACAPTYDNFPIKLATTVCDRLQECALGAFESSYDDLAECREEVADSYETALDRIDDDDFDAKDAADCIAELKARDCEDVVSESFPRECGQIADYYSYNYY